MQQKKRVSSASHCKTEPHGESFQLLQPVSSPMSKQRICITYIYKCFGSNVISAISSPLNNGDIRVEILPSQPGG